MKPSDFKKIDGFEEVIKGFKMGKSCIDINCNMCPFSSSNSSKGIACGEKNSVITGFLGCANFTKRLQQAAIEFENMIKGDIMTKSDLVVGEHVVKIRQGDLYLVLKNELTGTKRYFEANLDNHTETLEYKGESDKHFDIIEVFEMNYGFVLKNLEDGTNLKSIWKRQEKSPTQIKLEELETKQREIADEIKQLRESM